MMARHQLGEELQDDEADALVAWLERAHRAVAKDYIAPPKLPAEPGVSPR